MERHDLIAQLLEVDEEGQASLLNKNLDLADSKLAWELKVLYDAYESSDPPRAAKVATTLTTLAQAVNDTHISALATWTNGIAAIYSSQLEYAHSRLTLARDQFLAANEPLYAAATQVSNFRVLAMLGRDEEAMQRVQWARELFVQADDQLAIGKMEQNLAILHFMRDRYVEAEVLLRSAHERFAAVGDHNELLSAENNLATALTAQYRFDEVDALYESALGRAEARQDQAAMALLECNVGCLALFQGHFDRALDYLERSRRNYAALNMPHELAIAEQEIADAYLEVNLAPEASAIYARVAPLFAELGMQAEEARALTYHGRAMLLQGQVVPAHSLLAQAQSLYQTLDNPVGEATVLLYLAEAAFLEANYDAVGALAEQTESAFAAVNAWGRLLQARWLRGEAARRLGDFRRAQQLLTHTLHDAQQLFVPQIAHRCFTSLGQLAVANGDAPGAESHFKSALEMIETMRAPLPAESFRIAFLSDKLTPYGELVRLCLADGTPLRVAEALGYVERARARALLDLLGNVGAPHQGAPDDPFSAQLVAQIETLREELNWFYSQINRPDSPSATRGPTALANLQLEAQGREATMLDLIRQLQQQRARHQVNNGIFDLIEFQRHLGSETILVEYFSLDEALLAFVVTDQTLDVVDLQCRESDVKALLQQFHFQLGALRYGSERMAIHQATLTERIGHHLSKLYEQLLRPISPYWETRRLLVAPHRALHYVPFHALYDGAQYVVESREICYTPSAAILHHCLTIPSRPLEHALLLGASDVVAPRIQDEVTTLASLFPTVQILVNERATRTALMDHAPAADLLHLACHGRFRADNPLFSALQLDDGWLTVHDAAQLNLNCNLVTLSACETGINTPAPGDELLGLVRGFLAAGAPSLLVSLWNVDDAATAQMMLLFYERLLVGDGAATALRHAQRQLLEVHPHPFFWAPFILFGRWK